MRSDKAEGLSWSTERGQGTRPVLRHKNGDSIKRGQLTSVMGFKTITLFTNVFMVNTTFIEKIIYERLQYLPMGIRLHRAIGCGDNGGGQTDFKTEVHCVYLTYSTIVLDVIESGQVIVMRNKCPLIIM